MTGPLRSLHQPFAVADTDRVRDRLIGAAITADVILEPADDDPRAQGHVPSVRAAPAAPRAVPTPTPGATRPSPTPPNPSPHGQSPNSSACAGDGLRLMPIASFVWGGAPRGRLGQRDATAMPRVRGDHVLVLVTQGALAVELPRLRHPVTQGRAAFIPAGTAFSLHPPAQIQGWALLIPPAAARALPVALPDAFRCGLPDAADRALLEPTLAALGQGSPRNPAEETAVLCQLGLLSVALSRLSAHSPDPDDPARQLAKARPLTQRFLDLVTANPAQDRTMAEIAADLGCSLAHLDRACLHSRGRPAIQLLYAVRCDRAAQLLRHTDRPVAQIATELGYSGLGHFLRAFAEATGRTPDSFRTSVRNPPPFGE